MVAALGLGTASAERMLVPARVASNSIPKDSEATPYMGYARVSKEWSHVAAVTGLPTDAFLSRECRVAVQRILKSPASTRWVSSAGSSYNLKGGYYTTAGTLDSANSYGALLRRNYICFSVFEGTAKGGRVYFTADLIGDR